MSKRDQRTLYEERQFLGPDRLDSVRAYLEESGYPNKEYPPHVEAGFMLAEEGVGHFCCYDCYDSRDGDSEDNGLLRVRESASRIVCILQGLIHAIDTYERDNFHEIHKSSAAEKG